MNNSIINLAATVSRVGPGSPTRQEEGLSISSERGKSFAGEKKGKLKQELIPGQRRKPNA